MSQEHESLVREAYEAYGRGDITRMLELVSPDLTWTYLDPGLEDPQPQTCHGREQLRRALEGQARRGLKSQIEEIASGRDKVMVVIHTPGLDQHRAWRADDRNYLVLTLQQGQVIAMRACRDRAQARELAGLR